MAAHKFKVGQSVRFTREDVAAGWGSSVYDSARPSRWGRRISLSDQERVRALWADSSGERAFGTTGL